MENVQQQASARGFVLEGLTEDTSRPVTVINPALFPLRDHAIQYVYPAGAPGVAGLGR